MANKLMRTKGLVSAIRDEDISLISALLQDGATPNLVLPVEGVSPFHLAVGSESKYALQFTTLLLKYDGNPNVRSTEGLTPLHVAASWGRFQALDLLLRNGGDPRLTDEDGHTPRDMAIASNHWDCIDLLDSWAHEEDDKADVQKRQDCLGGRVEERPETVNHQQSDVDWDVHRDQIYNSEQGHGNLHQCGNFHLPFTQSPYRNSLIADRMVRDASWSPCSATCSTSSSTGSESPHENSQCIADRIAMKDACWSPPSATSCSVFSSPGSEVSLGSPGRVTAIKSYLYDDDVEITFPKRPSIPSSLSSTSLHSSYDENTMNNAMRSLVLDSSSVSSVPSMLGNISDSSPSQALVFPEEKTEIKFNGRNCSNNNGSSNSSDIEQNDCSCSQSNLELDNRSDYQESLEPTGSSHFDPNASDTSSLDQLTHGMGLDVTSPDHAVVFSKGKIKDRRQTMACHLLYSSSSDVHEYSSDDDDARGEDVSSHKVPCHESPCHVSDSSSEDECAEFSCQSPAHAEGNLRHQEDGEGKKALTSEENPEAREIVDSGLTDNTCEDPSELSSYHTAINTGSLIDTSTQRRSIYRSKKSCMELVEDHHPSASSGSEPSLLDFSVIGADDTVVYDWTSFQSNEEEVHQTPPIPPELARLSNEDIMSRLKDLGEGAGPVTSSTRSVYLNLLVRLLRDSSSSTKRAKNKDNSSNINFQYELAEVINGTKALPAAHDLESEMVALFQQPDPKRKWREGILKSSFNYLLLDPRVTRDLPSRYPKLTQLETFRTFVSAIFYVGKGKRSRPYAHFEEAVKNVKKEKKLSSKVLHILDIWSGGMGVVSLHCFQNVIPVEAYTREAAMMDAIGMSRLTNAKRGDYYGVAHSWSGAKKRLVGVYLLNKACQIFLMEGERQIRSADITSGQ